MRTPVTILWMLFCCITASSSVGQTLLVDASRTRWRGAENVLIEDVYTTFEILVHTAASNEPYREVLQYTGKQEFPVSAEQVVWINYIDLQKNDNFVLWPLSEHRVGQSLISNPFTKFELVSLAQVREEVKSRLAMEIRRGDFATADRLLKDVYDVYQNDEADAATRGERRAWFYQLYQIATTESERYRMQPAFRNAANRAELVELEGGWHRWMIQENKRVVEKEGEERANTRLAYALQAWANFASSLYTRDGLWPEESLQEAKAKSLIRATFEIVLSEDLTLVQRTLLSQTIEPILTPRITSNLASRTLSSSLLRNLNCYQNLIAGSKKKPGFPVEAFGLADTERAIGAFNYFYHGGR